MKKQCLSALLALCLALSLLPAGTRAADGSAGYRIDFKNETITAESGWELSRDEGFEAPLAAGAAVTPGDTIYLREDGGAAQVIEIPARPDAPETPLKVEKKYTKSALQITVINNSEYVSCEYSWDGKTWASTSTKRAQTRNADLEIQVRYQATSDAFASESLSRQVTTPDWDGATTLKDGERFNNIPRKVIIANNEGTVTVAGSLEITIQLPEPGDIEVNGDSFVKVPAGSIVRAGEKPSVTLDASGTINPITGHITPEPEEQFPALNPGGTYWFDLSEANIPGVVNHADNSMKNIPGVPDKTLHYVPFTYAGTIDAYVLKSYSEDPDGNDSQTAANSTDTHDPIGCHYPHSLFIADYNVTNYVSWNTLEQENLIFGKDSLFGGVSYTLRAPSQGNERPSGTPMYEATPNRPNNNEWDTILNQAENDIYDNTSGYIKNWLGYESWGQDSFSDYNNPRIDHLSS